MNIKLHNKFEIMLGDQQCHVCYNTVTHVLYERLLDNLSPFATYMVFGSSATELDYNDTKIGHYEARYPTTLEEIQCDPSLGEMYVKRVLSFDEDEAVGLAFSELGLAFNNQDNPEICNHALITDSNGNCVQITKQQGQTLLVRVTIYLSFTPQSQTVLTAGQNPLVRALLGERDCDCTFTATRGYNLQPNQCIPRNMPRDAQLYQCQLTTCYNHQSNPTINIDFDISTGITPEIVLLLSGTPVARINVLEHKELVHNTQALTSQSNFTIDCGEWVKSVTAVTDPDGKDITGQVVVKNYASEFSDYIKDPFDAPLAASNARWVSKDCDKFAFMCGGSVHVYINQNYSLKKVSATIPTEGLKNIIMFDSYVFVVYSSMPFLRVYTLADYALTELATDFTNYTYVYSWQEVSIIQTTTGGFIIGVLNTLTKIPILIDAKIINGVFTVTGQRLTQCTSAQLMYDIYKSSFCGSAIAFVTNNYQNKTENYRIENFYDDGTTTIGNSLYAYYMCTDTVSLQGKSRAAVAKRGQAPYIWLFYYPTIFRYGISLTESVENWVSGDLMYVIQGYPNGPDRYVIYSLTNYNNPQAFSIGFPKDINLSEVVDFEFLKDTLLIFTNSGVKALNLKLTCAVLENLPKTNTNYNVQLCAYNLLGSTKTEGVSGTFTVEFKL